MNETHKDLDKALSLLAGLVEFADMQKREGLIDGACDPDIYVSEAINLIRKYGVLEDGDTFAIQA